MKYLKKRRTCKKRHCKKRPTCKKRRTRRRSCKKRHIMKGGWGLKMSSFLTNKEEEVVEKEDSIVGGGWLTIAQ